MKKIYQHLITTSDKRELELFKLNLKSLHAFLLKKNNSKKIKRIKALSTVIEYYLKNNK